MSTLGSARAEARRALAGCELEELGYHVTQSMVSRYEQGLLEAPLTMERMVGWALCCEGLSSRRRSRKLPWRSPATTYPGTTPTWRRSTSCCAATGG